MQRAVRVVSACMRACVRACAGETHGGDGWLGRLPGGGVGHIRPDEQYWLIHHRQPATPTLGVTIAGDFTVAILSRQ